MHRVILHTRYDNKVTEYNSNDCPLLLEKLKRTLNQEKKSYKINHVENQARDRSNMHYFQQNHT